MRNLIYKGKNARAWLATDHPASRYGQPVLLVQIGKSEVQAIGWSKVLPSNLLGWEFLEKVLAGDLGTLKKLSAEAQTMLEALLRDVRAWRGNYWDGGSKSDYIGLDIVSGKTTP